MKNIFIKFLLMFCLSSIYDVQQVSSQVLEGLSEAWTFGDRANWTVEDGILKSIQHDIDFSAASSADTGDPSHLWVDLDFGTDYTVKADIRIDEWEVPASSGNHKKGGVAVRINPDDDQRAINLNFQNNIDQVIYLNDFVAFGPAEPYPWDFGVWFTFTLTVEGQTVTGRVEQTDDPGFFVDMPPWDFEGRETGFPGLTASRAIVPVSYDNFEVIVNGETVFSDSFDGVSSKVNDWSIHE